MNAKESDMNLTGSIVNSKLSDKLIGYPVYPANEDIYSKYHKEEEINPEEITKVKGANEKRKAGVLNEKEFVDDVSGSDLDIPYSEFDNENEIGSEDEENDYYSLGGDDHSDLDENTGE